MKPVLYLCTAPPPALSGTDAMFQDIERMMIRFGGSLINLYPFNKPSRFVPHWLMGWHNQSQLRAAMKNASRVHVFSATLKPLPCIHAFKGPVIYTVTASAGEQNHARWLNGRDITVVVNHERDARRLRDQGVVRVVEIHPGLELSHMNFSPAPATPFTLLVGSAPWTRAQFRTKGIDVLLEAAKQIPDMNLVFLWRKLWYDDLIQRVRQHQLESRVVIHNTLMDVNQVLAGCHATAVLAEHNRLVKAWPHSTIESLAAGKPALLSRVIPMADFVEQHKAGVAVDSLQRSDMIAAIARLKSCYPEIHGQRLRELTQQHFDVHAMLDRYANVYAGLA